MKMNRLPFPNIKFICKQGKFTSIVYRKFNFSGAYSSFERFLPPVYKFDVARNLVYRCFSIFSNWTQFHAELTCLLEILRKNV